MPEPSPAKTKMSMEMNSAKAALSASIWPTSAGDPNAMLVIAILKLISSTPSSLISNNLKICFFPVVSEADDPLVTLYIGGLNI